MTEYTDPPNMPDDERMTDAEFRAAHPEVSFPASWHRQVVARIAQEVPGLSIAYAPPGKE